MLKSKLVKLPPAASRAVPTGRRRTGAQRMMNGNACTISGRRPGAGGRHSARTRWPRHGSGDVARDGTQADAVLQRLKVAAVVLDIGLPGIDGFEVVRRLRARGDAVPVLLLTARDAVQDRVHGLELGADDYLVKPFAAPELVARLKALVRRSNPKTAALQVGGLVLNPFSRRACVNGWPSS